MTRAMRLDDAQIERYSRQIVLAEIGPRGQARLAAARVAVAATGVGAERVAAYLAAAGVGTLALPAALRAAVDPGQRDVVVVPLAGERGDAGERADAPFDAVLVADGDAWSAAPERPDAGGAAADAPAPRTFWMADGRAAELPPCPRCARAALGPAPAVDAISAPLRDAVLGTVVATEIVKALLAIGTPLRGHVLAYDVATAALALTPVAARAGCACGG